MQEYTEFVLKHNQEMPDPTQNILRISDLHSWYKHLGNFTKAYPLLAQGEEPRYGFDPRFTDENRKNFHWRIVMTDNIDRYPIKISDDAKYQLIPDDIKEFMKKYPIYLNSGFSSQDTENAKFLRLMCKNMCEEFWNGLVEYQNQNKVKSE